MKSELTGTPAEVSETSRTHIERANPAPLAERKPYVMPVNGIHDNRAYQAGETLMLTEGEAKFLGVSTPVPVDRGPQKPYAMLAAGVHDGQLHKAGATVMLYDDEVGPHHRALDKDDPVVVEPVERHPYVLMLTPAEAASRGPTVASIHDWNADDPPLASVEEPEHSAEKRKAERDMRKRN